MHNVCATKKSDLHTYVLVFTPSKPKIQNKAQNNECLIALVYFVL